MHKYEEELFDIVILNVFVLLKNGQGRQCSIKACEMLKYLEKYTKM